MSWRIAVRHRTGYQYANAVRASYNEARMTPADDRGQRLLESRLQVTPPARALRYTDYWQTVVDAFDVHVAHTELVVTASSVVQTAEAVPLPSGVEWEQLGTPATLDRFVELLAESRYVCREAEVSAAGASLSKAGPPTAAGLAAAAWAHDQLAYERGATGVHTTSAEARAAGSGVCQDYAHVTLAVLRSMGLPARYVSGYLFPRTGAEPALGETARGESHAWVEFWAGDWVPLDPTSLDEVGERHVVVARGRDYADVRPLSGIYHGPPAQSLGVEVELTRLQ